MNISGLEISPNFSIKESIKNILLSIDFSVHSSDCAFIEFSVHYQSSKSIFPFIKSVVFREELAENVNFFIQNNKTI